MRASKTEVVLVTPALQLEATPHYEVSTTVAPTTIPTSSSGAASSSALTAVDDVVVHPQPTK